MWEKSQIRPLVLRHLRSRECKTAMITLKLRFWDPVFPQNKGSHKTHRKLMGVSTQRRSHDEPSSIRYHRKRRATARIDEARSRLPVPALMRRLVYHEKHIGK